MIDADMPFVLLSDGRHPAAPSRLYRHPAEIIRADATAEVMPALDRVAEASAQGKHVAGHLGYEAGFALEPRLNRLQSLGRPALPLLWFGAFDRCETIERRDLAAFLPDGTGATALTPEPLIDRAVYEAGVREAQALIAAGEIYQANLSFAASVRFAGHPLALYSNLAARAAAGWGGALFTGTHWLLSASPELFFTLEDGRLTARPMKGTAPRQPDKAEDRQAAATLAVDPKQRAENLMIVDLIRNDLSRVSAAGSVKVPRLFDIETYPTFHTLTSTVEAVLTPSLGAVDVLRAMFPCGSITGAPKIRAMEAIAAIEPNLHGGCPRGAYTGSMGSIAPGGDASFNVLIRTLTVERGGTRATLGLGAGIVADSKPADEWHECLAKSAFVTVGQRSFDLLETMRFDPAEGLADLDRHLERMKASAQALGFRFDRHGVRNALQAATFRLQTPHGVRLRLSAQGETAIEARALPTAPGAAASVALAALPVASEDFRLRHKTSDRAFYDDARTRAGTFEVVFVGLDGFLTEGSFTNVFVPRNGALLTPSARRGLLPGVLRARLIDEGRAIEAELTPRDLCEGFWIGNALRGLIAAQLGEPRQ